jgi:hypothetical protein
VPDAEALPAFVRLLRVVVYESMRDMQNTLREATADSAATEGSPSHPHSEPATPMSTTMGSTTGSVAGATATGMAFKKTEELIVSRLNMIEKALRGAAEILGDVTTESENLVVPPPPVSWRLSTTGREQLINHLPDAEDRLFLQTLRIEILRFLINLQDALYTQIPATHAYAALKNNTAVQTLWLDLFNLVVTRRMACLKDIESVRKYLRYSIKSGRSSVTNVVYHRLKEHAFRKGESVLSPGAAAGPDMSVWRQQLSTLGYWKYHDSSTSSLACMAWAQHIMRCRMLSSEAIRRCEAPSFVRCLDVLLQRLCNHEYDEIRKIALKQFDAVSTRFGSKMLATVEGVLNSVRQGPERAITDKASYWEVSGTLSVLAQNRVQKRILGDPQLLQVLDVLLFPSWLSKKCY